MGCGVVSSREREPCYSNVARGVGVQCTRQGEQSIHREGQRHGERPRCQHMGSCGGTKWDFSPVIFSRMRGPHCWLRAWGLVVKGGSPGLRGQVLEWEKGDGLGPVSRAQRQDLQ